MPCGSCILIVLLIDDEQDGAGLLAGRERMTFNLSEKRGEWNCKTGWEARESFGGAAKFYREEDVKEFIRLLKLRIGKEIVGELSNESSIKKAYLISEELINDIDKLCGDKLK